MLEIKNGGLLVARDKKELLEGLKVWVKKRTNATKIFPSGVVITFGTLLSIKCKCGIVHQWVYRSKIPTSSFQCNCERLLISYIKNRKYRFISR